MREDEDHLRQYGPLLRRIIILVAVLTAIPVVMWTITAFVGTYVGPLHAPTLKRTATRAEATTSEAAATPAENPPTRVADAAHVRIPARAVVAKVVAPDPVQASPADNSALAAAAPIAPAAGAPTGSVATSAAAASSPAANSADAMAGPASPAATTGSVAAVPVAPSRTSSNSATSPAVSKGAAGSIEVASSQPAPAEWSAPAPTDWPAPPALPTASSASPATPSQAAAADTAPAVQPIAGGFPLPQKRPHSFMVAQANIPMPQPRPDTAGTATPPAAATPLGFLHEIFHPASTAAPAAEPDPAHQY
jgi:hypothetical protein